jgi:sugar lactone lactonase YvrE
MPYRKVHVIAGRGAEPDRFSVALNGICVDSKGLIYAVGDSKVKVFDGLGRLQGWWPTEIPGYCVAVRDDSSVYIGEAGQVEIFDASGKRISTWRDAERLAFVTTVGFFKDSVLVADAKDRCIRRFDAAGRWLNDIGKSNRTKGFLIPNGHLDFAIDAQGIIHAPNPGKHRVERYTLNGELLGHFGRFGGRRPEDFPGCCNPTNLALTTQGHVVVTEKAGPRMKVYDADHRLIAMVGSEEFDANCKNMDVAVDSQGRVYVVDTVAASIVVFAPLEGDGIAPGTPPPTAEQGETQP